MQRTGPTWLLPPRLYLLLSAGMVGAHWALPGPTLVAGTLRWMGVAPWVGGVVLSAAAKGQFQRVATNVNTFNEPDKLVSEGLFRHSRNPMYLGLALSLGGLGMMLGTPAGLVGPALFVLAASTWYIPFEERVMADKFGERFADYRRRTRRWF